MKYRAARGTAPLTRADWIAALVIAVITVMLVQGLAMAIRGREEPSRGFSPGRSLP